MTLSPVFKVLIVTGENKKENNKDITEETNI